MRKASGFFFLGNCELLNNFTRNKMARALWVGEYKQMALRCAQNREVALPGVPKKWVFFLNANDSFS